MSDKLTNHRKLKVLVFGDSWAYHSHKKQANMLESHDSLNFQCLFSDQGIQCENFSIPGGSNIDSIKQIQENIDSISAADLVIVFQTELFRHYIDWSIENLDLKDQVNMPKVFDFDHFQHLLCTEFYNELSTQQSITQTPFLLVGGCNKLHTPAIPHNLYYIESSWSELIEPENFCDCFEYWVEPSLLIFNYLQHKYNWPGGLVEFKPIEQRILVKNHLWQINDNFGWCHPADGGYRIMFDKLIEKMHDIGVLNEHYSKTGS
jgi:hypothetical protein